MQNSFAVTVRATKYTSLGGQGTISATNPPTSDNIVLSSKCPLIGTAGKELMPSRDLKRAVVLSLLYEVRYTAWVLIFTLLIHK